MNWITPEIKINFGHATYMIGEKEYGFSLTAIPHCFRMNIRFPDGAIFGTRLHLTSRIENICGQSILQHLVMAVIDIHGLAVEIPIEHLEVEEFKL